MYLCIYCITVWGKHILELHKSNSRCTTIKEIWMCSLYRFGSFTCGYKPVISMLLEVLHLFVCCNSYVAIYGDNASANNSDK